jgi:histidine ammonia-lyase
MGMTAALKLKQVVANAEYLLAIEMMTAAQGLEYRLPLRSARSVEAARLVLREKVPRLGEDRVLSGDIEQIASLIRHGSFDQWAE